jgi:D-arabinose 1-dehydrogenase-like Zn-dependent alcohol dehydrogenase
LMCAGVTTFNALRHSGAQPSSLVAIQGVGGLGHLAIQFARKFGYRVVAIGRGPSNSALARELGAELYIDGAAADPAAELRKLGGAQVILSTAPSGKAMSALIGGLGPHGTFLVVGAGPEPLEVAPLQLILGEKRIQGWDTGTAPDSEDTLLFARMTGVRPIIERYPLANAADAYARMLSGQARFRSVLTM